MAALSAACRQMLRQGGARFGNGRDVRVFWERTREAHAGQVMQLQSRTEILHTIEATDINLAIRNA